MNSSLPPLVSVYMPTKNRLALLKQAIQSITAQSYPNIEILIVDDGSTDGTYQYLCDLKNSMANLQVFRHEKSIGACAARNLAIKHAKGEFVTGLDDDDLFLPDRISSLIEAYDAKFAFVCSSMWWDYGKKKRLIDSTAGEISLSKQLSYNEATTQVLVKKERMIEVGAFDESFVACQDYDLWTRLIIKFGAAYRIAQPSYIINDTATTDRMISNPKSVRGYMQFLDKHKALMSEDNLKNQRFMRLRREGKKMSLGELFQQIGSGYFGDKLRYFLSSNFAFIRKIRRKIYR